MIFFDRRWLERAVREYVERYHGKRDYQGVGKVPIESGDEIGYTGGVGYHERLDGMLKYYHRRVA
jgi:hypothetical protein